MTIRFSTKSLSVQQEGTQAGGWGASLRKLFCLLHFLREEEAWLLAESEDGEEETEAWGVRRRYEIVILDNGRV